MTSARHFAHVTALCLLVVLAGVVCRAQVTPSGDSYTDTATATKNYGSATVLAVDGATAVTYIQFNLASVPTTASISQATLKLYVNSVTTAGSFNVDYVNGGWEESTIDASNAPPLGSSIASNVSITTADKNQYILINVTSAVQAWLSGSETNNGIALVANSDFNATFDSKENTTTSHPAELDIAFAGGDGTITGVTTASGSGLSGGGTSGTLSLSIPSGGVTNTMLKDSTVTLNANSAGGLTTPGAMTLGGTSTIGLMPCSANQVLQYSGSAWNCSTASTGTITGVTAGTGISGGGTSGAVTVGINTAVVPELAANNTFTGTQTVNNNVTVKATGTTLTASGGTIGVSGTGSGSSSFGVWGTASTAGIYGYSGGGDGVQGTSNSGVGVYGTSTSVIGVYGTSGSGYGVYGTSTDSNGVYGTSTDSNGVYGASTSGYGVYGSSSSNTGVYGASSGTAAGSAGVYGYAQTSTSNQTYGVIGNNLGSNYGAGVYAQDSTTGTESNTGSSLSGTIGAGVWGDGGIDWEVATGNVGVVGTAEDGDGVFAANNSPSRYTLQAINYNNSGYTFYAKTSAGEGCTIDPSGDINCTGSKNAVVPIDGGTRKVALSAIESPKNWFEDFGSASLSNGSAVVTIDREYAQTVNSELEYHVFLTPNGDCKGLYVSQRTPASFEVRELGGGTSNIEFSYRIVALRKNFENIRMADHTNDPDPTKQMKAMMEKRGTSGTPFRFQSPKLSPPKAPAAPSMLHPVAQLNTPAPALK
jgi:hypothetical protein